MAKSNELDLGLFCFGATTVVVTPLEQLVHVLSSGTQLAEKGQSLLSLVG